MYRYVPLVGSYFSLARIQHTYFGRIATDLMLKALEFIRIAPTGTANVSKMLNYGAMGLADGGITGTFTPMYFFVVEKPKE